MRNIIQTLVINFLLIIFSTTSLAQSTCISGTLTPDTSQAPYYYPMTLTITNNCSSAQNFQGARITFISPVNLNTTYYGSFNPLAYPVAPTNITSTPNNDGTYTASLTLNLQQYTNAIYSLPTGTSITINYGIQNQSGMPIKFPSNSYVNVYIQGQPTSTGNISLEVITPSGFVGPTNSPPTFNLSSSSGQVTTYQGKWISKEQTINNIPLGSYTVSANSVTVNNENYIVTPSPTSLTVSKNSTPTLQLKYTLPSPTNGTIQFIATIPDKISSPSNPIISIKAASGNTQSITVPWSQPTDIQLPADVVYSFSTPSITSNSYSCAAQFSPTSVSLKVSPTSLVNLTYQCKAITPVNVKLNVSGLPSTTPSSSVTITFTDQNQKTTTTKGDATSVSLYPGTYTVTTSPVNNYGAAITPPSPITISENFKSTISVTYSPSTIDATFPYGAAPQGNVGVTADYYATPETILGSWAMLAGIQNDANNGLLPSFMSPKNTVYAVGTAAIGNILGIEGCPGGCNQINGYCFAIRFNEKNKDNYQYMIFQSVNIAASTNTFDIYLPGGGDGAFKSFCVPFWGTSTLNWANHIEDDNGDCNTYFNSFQPGTFKSNYSVTYAGTSHDAVTTLKNACSFAKTSGFSLQNFLDIDVIPVTCPQSLTQITGVRLNNETKVGNWNVQTLNSITTNSFTTPNVGFNISKNTPANWSSSLATTQMQDCKTNSAGYLNNTQNTMPNYQATISASLTAPILKHIAPPPPPPNPALCNSSTVKQYGGFCSWDSGKTDPGQGNYCDQSSANCLGSCNTGGAAAWCTCDKDSKITCTGNNPTADKPKQ